MKSEPKEACFHCGAKVKSSKARYCNRCYKKKAKLGTLARARSSYRAATFKAQMVRAYDKLDRNKGGQIDSKRKRKANGTFERSEGRQLSVDAKIITHEEDNRLLHAARRIKASTEYVCRDVRVTQSERAPEWDQWSIQITNGASHWYSELGLQPQPEQRLFLTPAHRSPSCCSNEMIFMAASRCTGRPRPKVNANIKLVCTNGQPAIIMEAIKDIAKNELIAANCTIT